MATVFSTATLRVNADTRDLISGMQDANKSTTWLLENMSQSAKAFEANWKDLTHGIKDTKRIISGILISQGFYALSNALVTVSSAALEFSKSMETASVSLEYFVNASVGTEEAAARVTAYLREVNEFAARTPFNTDQVLALSKYMQAVGVSINQTQSVLSVITDTAAATGAGTEQLQRITFALGQMITKGRVANEEIRQLANANIPIYDILREELHLTGEEISRIGKHWVDADKAVVAILRGLEKRYDGAADRIADTFAGLTDTIIDDAKIISNVAFGGVYDSMKSTAMNLRNTLDYMRQLVTEKGMPGLFNDMALKIDPTGALGNFLLSTIGNLRNLAHAFSELYHSAAPALHLMRTTFAATVNASMIALTAMVRTVMSVADALGFLDVSAGFAAKAIGSLYVAYKTTKFVSVFGQAIAQAGMSAYGAAQGILSLVPASVHARTQVIALTATVAALVLQLSAVAGLFGALQNGFAGLSGDAGLSGFDKRWEEAYSAYEKKMEAYNAALEKYREEYREPYTAMAGTGGRKAPKDTDKKKKKGGGSNSKDHWIASFDEVFVVPEDSKTGAFQDQIKEDFSDLLEILRGDYTFPSTADIPEKPEFNLGEVYGDGWLSGGSSLNPLHLLLPTLITGGLSALGRIFARQNTAKKVGQEVAEAVTSSKFLTSDEATKLFTKADISFARHADRFQETMSQVTARQKAMQVAGTTDGMDELRRSSELANKQLGDLRKEWDELNELGITAGKQATKSLDFDAAQKIINDSQLRVLTDEKDTLIKLMSNSDLSMAEFNEMGKRVSAIDTQIEKITSGTFEISIARASVGDLAEQLTTQTTTLRNLLAEAFPTKGVMISALNKGYNVEAIYEVNKAFKHWEQLVDAYELRIAAGAKPVDNAGTFFAETMSLFRRDIRTQLATVVENASKVNAWIIAKEGVGADSVLDDVGREVWRTTEAASTYMQKLTGVLADINKNALNEATLREVTRQATNSLKRVRQSLNLVNEQVATAVAAAEKTAAEQAKLNSKSALELARSVTSNVAETMIGDEKTLAEMHQTLKDIDKQISTTRKAVNQNYNKQHTLKTEAKAKGESPKIPEKLIKQSIELNKQLDSLETERGALVDELHRLEGTTQIPATRNVKLPDVLDAASKNYDATVEAFEKAIPHYEAAQYASGKRPARYHDIVSDQLAHILRNNSLTNEMLYATGTKMGVLAKGVDSFSGSIPAIARNILGMKATADSFVSAFVEETAGIGVALEPLGRLTLAQEMLSANVGMVHGTGHVFSQVAPLVIQNDASIGLVDRTAGLVNGAVSFGDELSLDIKTTGREIIDTLHSLRTGTYNGLDVVDASALHAVNRSGWYYQFAAQNAAFGNRNKMVMSIINRDFDITTEAPEKLDAYRKLMYKKSSGVSLDGKIFSTKALENFSHLYGLDNKGLSAEMLAKIYTEKIILPLFKGPTSVLDTGLFNKAITSFVVDYSDASFKAAEVNRLSGAFDKYLKMLVIAKDSGADIDQYLKSYMYIMEDGAKQFMPVDTAGVQRKYTKLGGGSYKTWFEKLLGEGALDDIKYRGAFLNAEGKEARIVAEIDSLAKKLQTALKTEADPTEALTSFSRAMKNISDNARALAQQGKLADETVAAAFGNMATDAVKYRSLLYKLADATAVLAETPTLFEQLPSVLRTVVDQTERLNASIAAGGIIKGHDISELAANYKKLFSMLHMETNRAAYETGQQINNLNELFREYHAKIIDPEVGYTAADGTKALPDRLILSETQRAAAHITLPVGYADAEEQARLVASAMRLDRSNGTLDLSHSAQGVKAEIDKLQGKVKFQATQYERYLDERARVLDKVAEKEKYLAAKVARRDELPVLLALEQSKAPSEQNADLIASLKKEVSTTKGQITRASNEINKLTKQAEQYGLSAAMAEQRKAALDDEIRRLTESMDLFKKDAPELDNLLKAIEPLDAKVTNMAERLVHFETSRKGMAFIDIEATGTPIHSAGGVVQPKIMQISAINPLGEQKTWYVNWGKENAALRKSMMDLSEKFEKAFGAIPVSAFDEGMDLERTLEAVYDFIGGDHALVSAYNGANIGGYDVPLLNTYLDNGKAFRPGPDIMTWFNDEINKYLDYGKNLTLEKAHELAVGSIDSILHMADNDIKATVELARALEDNIVARIAQIAAEDTAEAGNTAIKALEEAANNLHGGAVEDALVQAGKATEHLNATVKAYMGLNTSSMHRVHKYGEELVDTVTTNTEVGRAAAKVVRMKMLPGIVAEFEVLDRSLQAVTRAVNDTSDPVSKEIYKREADRLFNLRNEAYGAFSENAAADKTLQKMADDLGEYVLKGQTKYSKEILDALEYLKTNESVELFGKTFSFEVVAKTVEDAGDGSAVTAYSTLVKVGDVSTEYARFDDALAAMATHMRMAEKAMEGVKPAADAAAEAVRKVVKTTTVLDVDLSDFGRAINGIDAKPWYKYLNVDTENLSKIVQGGILGVTPGAVDLDKAFSSWVEAYTKMEVTRDAADKTNDAAKAKAFTTASKNFAAAQDDFLRALIIDTRKGLKTGSAMDLDALGKALTADGKVLAYYFDQTNNQLRFFGKSVYTTSEELLESIVQLAKDKAFGEASEAIEQNIGLIVKSIKGGAPIEEAFSALSAAARQGLSDFAEGAVIWNRVEDVLHTGKFAAKRIKQAAASIDEGFASVGKKIFTGTVAGFSIFDAADIGVTTLFQSWQDASMQTMSDSFALGMVSNETLNYLRECGINAGEIFADGMFDATGKAFGESVVANGVINGIVALSSKLISGWPGVAVGIGSALLSSFGMNKMTGSASDVTRYFPDWGDSLNKYETDTFEKALKNSGVSLSTAQTAQLLRQARLTDTLSLLEKFAQKENVSMWDLSDEAIKAVIEVVYANYDAVGNTLTTQASSDESLRATRLIHNVLYGRGGSAFARAGKWLGEYMTGEDTAAVLDETNQLALRLAQAEGALKVDEQSGSLVLAADSVAQLEDIKALLRDNTLTLEKTPIRHTDASGVEQDYYRVMFRSKETGAIGGYVPYSNEHLDELLNALDVVANGGASTGEMSEAIRKALDESPLLRELLLETGKYDAYRMTAGSVLPAMLTQFNKLNGTNYTMAQVDQDSAFREQLMKQAIYIAQTYEAAKLAEIELLHEMEQREGVDLKGTAYSPNDDTNTYTAQVLMGATLEGLTTEAVKAFEQAGIDLAEGMQAVSLNGKEMGSMPYVSVSIDEAALTESMRGITVDLGKVDTSLSNLTVTAQQAEILAKAGIQINGDGTVSLMKSASGAVTGNERDITLTADYVSDAVEEAAATIGMKFDFDAGEVSFDNFDKIKDKLQGAIFSLSSTISSSIDAEPVKQALSKLGTVTEDGLFKITNKAILSGQSSMQSILDGIDWTAVPDNVKAQMEAIAELVDDKGGTIQQNLIEWSDGLILESPFKNEAELTGAIEEQFARIGITFTTGINGLQQMIVANTGEALRNGVALISEEEYAILNENDALKTLFEKLQIVPKDLGSHIMIDLRSALQQDAEKIVGIFVNQPEMWQQIPDTFKNVLAQCKITANNGMLEILQNQGGHLVELTDGWVMSFKDMSEETRTALTVYASDTDEKLNITAEHVEKGLLKIRGYTNDSEIPDSVNKNLLVPFAKLPTELQTDLLTAGDTVKDMQFDLTGAMEFAFADIPSVVTGAGDAASEAAEEMSSRITLAVTDAMNQISLIKQVQASMGSTGGIFGWDWTGNVDHVPGIMGYDKESGMTYIEEVMPDGTHIKWIRVDKNKNQTEVKDEEVPAHIRKKASGGTTSGLTLAGELGEEMAILPNGLTTTVDAGLYDFPAGTQIINARDTAAIKKYAGAELQVQKYAAGTPAMRSFVPSEARLLAAAVGQPNGGIDPTGQLSRSGVAIASESIDKLANNVATRIYEYMAPMLVETDHENAINYIGTLVASDDGLRELERKLGTIRTAERRRS